MANNDDRKTKLFFWLTIPLLLLYTLPLYTAPLAYWLAEKYTQGHILYYTFVPFFGERHGLIDNLTRLIAPLIAAFAAFAFVGPRNFRRTITLIVLLVVIFAFSMIDVSLLTEERNLASLNAHEVDREITRAGVYITLERYQEILLTLIATILGITIATKPEGV